MESIPKSASISILKAKVSEGYPVFSLMTSNNFSSKLSEVIPVVTDAGVATGAVAIFCERLGGVAVLVGAEGRTGAETGEAVGVMTGGIVGVEELADATC